jgi:hypothetical protein
LPALPIEPGSGSGSFLLPCLVLLQAEAETGYLLYSIFGEILVKGPWPNFPGEKHKPCRLGMFPGAPEVQPIVLEKAVSSPFHPHFLEPNAVPGGAIFQSCRNPAGIYIITHFHIKMVAY